MKKYSLMAALLIFCACNSANSPQYANANMLPNRCPNVTYADRSLDKALACDEVPVYESSGLQANITLSNLRSSDLNLKISVDWFNNGVHINTQDLGKKEIMLLKQDTQYLRFSAPSNLANSYKIRIFKIKGKEKK